MSREINRTEVFNVIRDVKLISRSALAESVSVSRATVSSIVSDLINIKLLEEVGEGESTGGRRPIKLRYCPENKYAVGVVLFNNWVHAVLTDMEGSPLDNKKILVGATTPAAMLQAMKTAVEEILRNIPREKVLGIGVGAPGVVDFDTGVINISVSQGWLDGETNVKDFFDEMFDLPVYVANRSRVAALGEFQVGIGRGTSNLIYLFIGEGIVAGIIINGKLYLGKGSSAGEIGHVSIVPDGPLCACGNRGCLEVYANKSAILAQARASARSNVDNLLQRNVDGNLDRLKIEHVFDSARQGDPYAQAALSTAGEKLGHAVSILINLFAPDMVAIGGPIGSEAGDLLIEPIINEVQHRTLPRTFKNTRIVTGNLGTEAIAIGAAVLAINHTPIDIIFSDQ